MRSLVLSGAKVRVYINGKAFGRVTSCDVSVETPTRTLYGIESMQPYELAPTIGKVTGQMSVLKLSGDGGAEGAGITVPFNLLARAQYFSIALVEVQKGTVIFESRRCSATSQRWSYASRALVQGQISFECLDWNGEVGRMGISER